MIERVDMPGALRGQILREADAAHPRECCGLIEGVRDGTSARAIRLHPTRNVADELDRFEIDPARQIELMRSLRGTGRDVIGCYHSHPNGRPVPSERDRAGGGEEDFLWLIAALGKDARVLAAFVCDGADFRAIAIDSSEAVVR